MPLMSPRIGLVGNKRAISTPTRLDAEALSTVDDRGEDDAKKVGKRDSVRLNCCIFRIASSRSSASAVVKKAAGREDLEALYAFQGGKPGPDPSIYETATPHRPAADHTARYQKTVVDQGAKRESKLIVVLSELGRTVSQLMMYVGRRLGLGARCATLTFARSAYRRDRLHHGAHDCQMRHRRFLSQKTAFDAVLGSFWPRCWPAP